jgi:hypothetical protein
VKKKYLFITVAVLIVIGGFIYKAANETTDNIVETDSDKKSGVIDPKIPPSLKTNPMTDPSVEKKNYRVHETAEDEQFVEFDKIENAWLVIAEEIIGADKYAQYVDLRNRNEKEKMQAYKEYHDYLRQKYGDKFTYNITDDQSIREKQINQRYLKELLTLIGPEKFKNYNAAKDELNEEIRRENKESIQIEF